MGTFSKPAYPQIAQGFKDWGKRPDVKASRDDLMKIGKTVGKSLETAGFKPPGTKELLG